MFLNKTMSIKLKIAKKSDLNWINQKYQEVDFPASKSYCIINKKNISRIISNGTNKYFFLHFLSSQSFFRSL